MNTIPKPKRPIPGGVDRALSSSIWVQLGWFSALIFAILAILGGILLSTSEEDDTLLVRDASGYTQYWLQQHPQVKVDEGVLKLKESTDPDLKASLLEKYGFELMADGTILVNTEIDDSLEVKAHRQNWLKEAVDIQHNEDGTLTLAPTSSQSWHQKLRGMLFHFLDPGNLYMEQYQDGGMIGFAAITSLLGMVFFSGLLISTMTNIIERRVSDVKMGLVTYKGMRDHYVIIGYGEITMSLIEDIFFKRSKHQIKGVTGSQDLPSESIRKMSRSLPCIIIFTNQDIPRVQAKIYSFLPKGLQKHIFFYAGNIESKDQLARLNFPHAKEVYVLGEREENGRDTKNLEAARIISDLRGPIGKGDPLTVNIQFDRLTSYSIIQKLTLTEEYTRYTVGGKIMDEQINTNLRPFNFYENWARLLWGYTGRVSSYAPLDYKRMEGDQYVHLVIVSFNRMGRALLFEALRLCHFPNYEPAKDGQPAKNKTRITLVDKQLAELMPAFLAEYPYLNQIADIDIDYSSYSMDVASEPVRQMLREESTNPNCQLTVAVCLQDADMSMSMGLSLPDEVYYTVEDKSVVPSETRVLIRQELQEGMSRVLEHDQHKYKHLHVFGMLSQGVSNYLLRDDMAMMVNAAYDTEFNTDEQNPVKRAILDEYHAYTAKHKLKDFNCIDMLISKEHRAFAEASAMKLWQFLPENIRFANRYQVDIYGLYQRYLGEDKLAEMEHMRWNADRSIMGYKTLPIENRFRNNAYMIHDLIVPFDQLDSKRQKSKKNEVKKDATVISNMNKLIAIYRERENA